MISIKIGAAMILTAAFVSGCATPVLMMKNEKTGQIARCGGGVGGSMAGGLIGYNIQKKTDKACVKDFEAKGFTAIKN